MPKPNKGVATNKCKQIPTKGVCTVAPPLTPLKRQARRRPNQITPRTNRTNRNVAAAHVTHVAPAKRGMVQVAPTKRVASQKTVQIVGAFNTGTNLVARVLGALFNVNVQSEGHTAFWKHTCLTKEFAEKVQNDHPNMWYVVVAKHPYWWFHSMRKAPYSLKTENPDLPVEAFIQQRINVHFPRMDYKTTGDNVSFDNFVDYYNQFYNACRMYLPKERTVWVRYIDFFENPLKCVMSWTPHFPLKPLKQIQSKNSKSETLKNKIDQIFVQPTKHHGLPRHGLIAKDYYKRQNLSKIFTQKGYDWINEKLDTNLMTHLGYKTRN